MEYFHPRRTLSTLEGERFPPWREKDFHPGGRIFTRAEHCPPWREKYFHPGGRKISILNGRFPSVWNISTLNEAFHPTLTCPSSRNVPILRGTDPSILNLSVFWSPSHMTPNLHYFISNSRSPLYLTFRGTRVKERLCWDRGVHSNLRLTRHLVPCTTPTPGAPLSLPWRKAPVRISTLLSQQ